MYIITTGLSPHDDYICHYGRKGMKWGEHIYSRDDIKRLKKFMRRKDIVEAGKQYKRHRKEEYAKLGYKEGVFSNSLKKGSELSRVTGSENENKFGRMYSVINNSKDSGTYKTMASEASRYYSRPMYVDEYTVNTKLRIAKGKSVANTIIKKYGDKNLKEMWDMYNDLNYRDKTVHLYDMVHGKIKNASQNDIDQANEALGMIQELARVKMHDLLYSDLAVRKTVDSKYRNLGYNAIVDIEDEISGIDFPLIVYDPEKKLKKKSSKQIW